MGSKRIPQLDQLRASNHSVAGHAGTLVDEEGKLFIKPCVQAEIDFYESANRDHQDFAELMPKYMGRMGLGNKDQVEAVASVAEGVLVVDAPAAADAASVIAAATEQVSKPAAKPPKDKAVVLENSSSGFTKPNILDAKMGERLWADDAPIEKKQRFDKISAETTHKNFGFRVAGMKVYKGSEDPAELDEEGYRVYDKSYGRTIVNDDNIVSELRKFIFNEAAGIDEDLGKAVCAGILRDIERIQEVLEAEESRMYSASVLFIVEGDGKALRKAIENNNAAVEAVNAIRAQRKAQRVDSGIALEDEDEDDEDLDIATAPMFSTKLIDFAHAQWTPGQGPDENVLKGVRSLKRIFQELAQ